MSQLKLFMLAPNLEVIGTLIEETDTSVTLEKTLLIRPVQTGPDGEFGLQMVPISPTSPEGKQKFQKAQMLGEVLDVPDQLERVYLERTTSLQLVSAVDEFEKLLTQRG